MATHDRIDARAAGMLTLMCMTWAAGQIATKIALAGISANWQAGLRCVGSALLVMAWARLRRIPLYERDGTMAAGLICGALFAAEFAFLFVGLELTTAARGVIFLYMAPFVVAIGAHVLIPGEAMNGTKLAGLVCAFAGLLVAVGTASPCPRAPNCSATRCASSPPWRGARRRSSSSARASRRRAPRRRCSTSSQ
jgi:drug/metabolite transporter (DMT)-like permease